MPTPDFYKLIFYALGALILGFAAMVAFGRNIIYSAFSLLGTFAGVAGLYIFLVADFVGIVQLFVYVGGITVLVIFAVMFTREIGEDIKVTNQSMNWQMASVSSLIVLGLLGFMIKGAPWKLIENRSNAPTTEAIGDLLLTQYLLPFELISLVLLVALVGAIVIARRVERPDAGEPTS